MGGRKGSQWQGGTEASARDAKTAITYSSHECMREEDPNLAWSPAAPDRVAVYTSELRVHVSGLLVFVGHPSSSISFFFFLASGSYLFLQFRWSLRPQDPTCSHYFKGLCVLLKFRLILSILRASVASGSYLSSVFEVSLWPPQVPTYSHCLKGLFGPSILFICSYWGCTQFNIIIIIVTGLRWGKSLYLGESGKGGVTVMTI